MAFESKDIIQMAGTGILAYVAFTLRRFVVGVDKLHKQMDRLYKIITILATEHRNNHPESKSLSLDELLKEED